MYFIYSTLNNRLKQYVSFTPQHSLCVSIKVYSIIPVLKMKKLRLRDVKSITQGHTANIG